MTKKSTKVAENYTFSVAHNLGDSSPISVNSSPIWRWSSQSTPNALLMDGFRLCPEMTGRELRHLVDCATLIRLRSASSNVWWRFLRRLHALQLFFRKVHLLVTEEPQQQLDGNKTAEMFRLKRKPPTNCCRSVIRPGTVTKNHPFISDWPRLIGWLGKGDSSLLGSSRVAASTGDRLS